MADHKMTLVDWLDDLCVRFIINLPQEELESVARICFQVEEAQWFYEDFIRPIDPTLPSLNLKQFCLKIFQHCPLLSAFTDEQHLLAYQEFLGYKTRVPVRGAIMLNEDMNKVLLVKGWKSSASWSFPRGKINKDEPDLECAIREVYEETGYDIHASGLVTDTEEVKAIDVTMREQHMRLFVFRGVPESTLFEPKTRKEISKISWYKLNDLPTLKKNKQGGQSEGGEAPNPNKFYMVAPFLGPLKKWIVQQRKVDAQQALHEDYTEDNEPPSEAYIEEQQSQLPQIGTSQINMIDPASELKRLLAVQSAQPQPLPVQHLSANQQQANSLLAMLRGGTSSMAAPGAPPQIPQTPLDQVGGFPGEPETPQVHHVKVSPMATSRPPPPFSPQQLHDHNVSPQYMDHNNRHEPQLGFHLHPQHPHQMLQHQMAQSARSQHMQQPDHRFPQQPSFMHQQMPQQHFPEAPAASQLPAPRLNNHAMSLLDAFRSGPTSARPVQSGPKPHAPGQASQQATAQQSALLGLFRGPTASPAASMPLASGAKSPQPAIVLRPLAQTISGDHLPLKPTPPPTVRKPSAASMINRTLPKAKRPVLPPAPSNDNENFPILGSKPSISKPAKPIASPSAPATLPSRPGRAQVPVATAFDSAASVRRSSSRPVSRGKPQPSPQPTKVTILQRPQEAPRAVSPPQPAPATSIPPTQPFKPQILKRGEAIPSPAVSPDIPELPATSVPAKSQKDALLSLFAQSQAPRKPSPLQSPQPFAAPEVEPRRHQAFMPPQIMSRNASQASSVHGPIGGERSRVGSTASTATIGRKESAAGLGGLGSPVQTGFAQPSMSRSGSLAGSVILGDGNRTPGTPVEKRGFLMDYLDGVVRGAK